MFWHYSLSSRVFTNLNHINWFTFGLLILDLFPINSLHKPVKSASKKQFEVRRSFWRLLCNSSKIFRPSRIYLFCIAKNHVSNPFFFFDRCSILWGQTLFDLEYYLRHCVRFRNLSLFRSISLFLVYWWNSFSRLDQHR